VESSSPSVFPHGASASPYPFPHSRTVSKNADMHAPPFQMAEKATTDGVKPSHPAVMQALGAAWAQASEETRARCADCFPLLVEKARVWHLPACSLLGATLAALVP
jgi:hypothetical protein